MKLSPLYNLYDDINYYRRSQRDNATKVRAIFAQPSIYTNAAATIRSREWLKFVFLRIAYTYRLNLSSLLVRNEPSKFQVMNRARSNSTILSIGAMPSDSVSTNPLRLLSIWIPSDDRRRLSPIEFCFTTASHIVCIPPHARARCRLFFF